MLQNTGAEERLTDLSTSRKLSGWSPTKTNFWAGYRLKYTMLTQSGALKLPLQFDG